MTMVDRPVQIGNWEPENYGGALPRPSHTAYAPSRTRSTRLRFSLPMRSESNPSSTRHENWACNPNCLRCLVWRSAQVR